MLTAFQNTNQSFLSYFEKKYLPKRSKLTNFIALFLQKAFKGTGKTKAKITKN